jgi:hypothetical protein
MSFFDNPPQLSVKQIKYYACFANSNEAWIISLEEKMLSLFYLEFQSLLFIIMLFQIVRYHVIIIHGSQLHLFWWLFP